MTRPTIARHYTTRDFFRQVPNALLARYFAKSGLFADIDFDSIKEAKPDALFDAWPTRRTAQSNGC